MVRFVSALIEDAHRRIVAKYDGGRRDHASVDNDERSGSDGRRRPAFVRCRLTTPATSRPLSGRAAGDVLCGACRTRRPASGTDAGKQLLRIISGGFNDILRVADNRVCAQIQRLRRQTVKERETLLRRDPELGMYAGRVVWLDEKQLLANLVTRAGLTRRERTLVGWRVHGMTQFEMAARSGLSQATIHRIEKAAHRKLQAAIKQPSTSLSPSG